MNMVGRELELQRLTDLLNRADSGTGGFAVVTGEAGIGKTRLVTEWTGVARRRGFVVLSGRAADGGGSLRPIAQALMGAVRDTAVLESASLRPFRAALSRVLPGMAAEDAGDALLDPTVVLGEGVLRLLRSLGGSGTLLLLEDLHWADPDTVALLDYLGGAINSSPVIVAATVRDDVPGFPVMRDLARIPGAIHIRLRPLSYVDANTLAEQQQPGLDESQRMLVITRAEGIPLLIEELLAGTSDAAAGLPTTVPDSFAEVVVARLRGLSDEHRRVLTAAALASDEPDWSLAAVITDVAEPSVLAAARAAADVHLLVAEENLLRWRHALTREAVVATLLPPERAALAGRAAQALQARGQEDDESAAADLLAAAGDRAGAAEIRLRHATGDIKKGAMRSAERRLEQLAEEGSLPIQVAIERVHLYTLTGDASRALEVGIAALDSATGDDHAELCLRLARAAVAARRWSDAEAYVERAGRPDDARSAVLRAEAAHGAGRIEEAIHHANQAVEQSRPDQHPEVLCEALSIVGRLARLRDPAASADAFRRASQVAAEFGLRPWRVEAEFGLGTAEALDQERSVRIRTARDLALDSGMLMQAGSAEVILAEQAYVAAGPRALKKPAHRVLELGAATQSPYLLGLGDLLLAHSNAVPGHERQMTAALASVEARGVTAPDTLAQAWAVQAMPRLLSHDLAGALGFLDRFADALVSHAPAAPVHQFGLWVLLRTILGEDDAEARTTLRKLPAGLRRANRGALQYAEAIAEGRRGDRDRAAETFAAAEDELSPVPYWHRLLRLFTSECALNDRWGDPLPQLRVDLAVHERDGNQAEARICRDLLRRAGVPTRRGRGESSVPAELRRLGVTSREMDVLRLVAGGLSNADIAQRLYLSPRTVETHVSSLLARTGSHSRQELRGVFDRLTP
jgi:DNA-binding CsgD family transcriptional regulator/tetratricopeptide (TPR) repeat protein